MNHRDAFTPSAVAARGFGEEPPPATGSGRAEVLQSDGTQDWRWLCRNGQPGHNDKGCGVVGKSLVTSWGMRISGGHDMTAGACELKAVPHNEAFSAWCGMHARCVHVQWVSLTAGCAAVIVGGIEGEELPCHGPHKAQEPKQVEAGRPGVTRRH